jgi:uncharacterized protein (TIGR02996 family)
VIYLYRSFDGGPSGRYAKWFPQATILEWFQHHWNHLAVEDTEESARRLRDLLQSDGWFLWNPFACAVQCPQSNDELLRLLNGSTHEHASQVDPFCLQVFTEEDGEGGALFYVDDAYLARAGERAAFLLHDDWKLPEEIVGNPEPFVPAVEIKPLSPRSTREGTSYLVWLERMSKYPLDDFPYVDRIEGVRLSDLARHLITADLTDIYWGTREYQLRAALLLDWPESAPIERAFLAALQANPHDEATWAAWADCCEEQGQTPLSTALLARSLQRFAAYDGKAQDHFPGHPDLALAPDAWAAFERNYADRRRGYRWSQVSASRHLVQACLDVSWTNEPVYAQVYLFDDVWAAAHPALANGLLRFATRWDVLSPDAASGQTGGDDRSAALE